MPVTGTSAARKEMTMGIAAPWFADEVGRILDTPGGDRADRGEDRLDQPRIWPRRSRKVLMISGMASTTFTMPPIARETGEPAEPHDQLLNDKLLNASTVSVKLSIVCVTRCQRPTKLPGRS